MSSSSNGGSNGTSHPYEARTRRENRNVETSRHEGIVKVIEVLAESPHSWEDAARKALHEAESSNRDSHVKSIYVKDMQAIVERGDIVRWRLNAKISFAVDRGDEASRGTEGRGRSRTETKAQGGQVMERMEEGRRHFREDRDEGRDRYESQEEGRYRGQSGYRMSEDEARRSSGSEGWEQPSDSGRHQNTAWRYGGEGRQEGRFAQDRYADEGYRYQTGGYPGQSYGPRESYRQSEYLGSDQQGRSGQFRGGEYGESQYRAGQVGGGQYDRGQVRPGPYSANARFAGQDTGGQFIGRQYRGSQLGASQFGGGQQGGHQGNQPGYYGQGGGPFAGGRNQVGGGHYYGGGQYGIEPPGYSGESNYRGEGYGREEGLGRQIQEFGGAMAGRVRRMFKGPKGYKRSDERIREDVCDTLSQIDEIDPSEIEVSVANGEVTLSGSVPERSMKWQAEQAVDHVSGVNDINNQLRVKRMDATSNMGSQQAASSTGSTMQSSKGSSSTRS